MRSSAYLCKTIYTCIQVTILRYNAVFYYISKRNVLEAAVAAFVLTENLVVPPSHPVVVGYTFDNHLTRNENFFAILDCIGDMKCGRKGMNPT